MFEKDKPEPIKASVIAYSDSITGNGLFFNPIPWVVTILAILGLSAIIWFPFVRSLNKSVSQLTNATEKIANEDFEVRVNETRGDELGRLGKSVNHLAERLSGFVHGQKRFLGDISHELNSPLARMNWALSILEERTDESNQKYIKDVKEEVELMAKLVDELLSYSKAGIKSAKAKLNKVNIASLIKQVVERETTEEAVIKIDCDEDVEALGSEGLLDRALSNVVRNAIRYAGRKGRDKNLCLL